jgi:hypothetical protein
MVVNRPRMMDDTGEFSSQDGGDERDKENPGRLTSAQRTPTFLRPSHRPPGRVLHAKLSGLTQGKEPGLAIKHPPQRWRCSGNE